MQGPPARTDASQAHLTPVNEVAAATTPASADSNAAFLADQALQPASETPPQPEPSLVVLNPDQLKAYNSTESGNTAEDPDATPDGQKVEQPQIPGKKFNTLDTLKDLHEQGRKLNEGKDLMARLRDARRRIGLTVHKIAQVVGRSGEIVTTPVNSLKNLTTVLVRNPEARKEIVKVVAQDAVEAARVVAQPVINEVVTLGTEYAEELIALRNTSITINGTEYIIVDEVIDTAVAAKDGVVQTARNAHELMTSTAKWIKNRVQSTQEMVSFHLTQAKAELLEIGHDRLNATGHSIDSAADRIREILMGKAEYLRKASVASREKAGTVALKSLERKGKIAELRALAASVPSRPEAFSAPISSTDPMFKLLNQFEQDIITDREKKEALHPKSLSNTIL